MENETKTLTHVDIEENLKSEFINDCKDLVLKYTEVFKTKDNKKAIVIFALDENFEEGGETCCAIAGDNTAVHVAIYKMMENPIFNDAFTSVMAFRLYEKMKNKSNPKEGN
jgi:hypothetical protein